MRNGGRITTALLLAVAFCATAPGALAGTDQTGDDQDSYILAALARPAPAQAPSSQLSQDPARFLLFSTTDLWRHGGFAHGGANSNG